MTLRQAIDEGMRRGPLVVESLPVQRAASDFARHPGASLPAPPQVTVMAGARSPNNLPTGPEVALTVQQEISPRGLGSARRHAAEWAERAASSDVERARIEGGALAALAWLDLLEAQELLRLRVTAAEDAAKLARIADIRTTSGIATGVERSLAKAEVGSAQLAVLDGEGRATEARLALTHATGEAMDRIVVAEGVLDPTDERDISADGVRRGVDGHPAIRAAEARSAQSAAEASALHASLGPTFSVGATVWREGSGDRAAAAIVSIPLPFLDPARYDTARQTTLAAAASGHAARLRLEYERELRLALHEREHTREVRKQLRDGVVTPLQSALTTAMTAYAAGTNDLQVVLLARRSSLQAQERLVMAMADVWRADIRVAALSGSLTGEAMARGGAPR